MGSTNDGTKPRFYYQKQLGVMGTICWKSEIAEKIKNIQNHYNRPKFKPTYYETKCSPEK